MKQLFRCADHYIQSRDWKMLTGLKFCLCSIGILLGVLVPVKHKKTVAAGAFGVFLATYIPLMTDFLTFAAFCAAERPPVRLPAATQRCQRPGLIDHFMFNHNIIMLCHSLKQRVG